jgi:hypothetical protein
MFNPTIHGANYAYRGPKNRQDISGLLTSAQYDLARCRDEAARLRGLCAQALTRLVTGQSPGLDLTYRSGAARLTGPLFASSLLQDRLAGLTLAAAVTEPSLTNALARCEQIARRGTHLLYGG